LRNSFLPALVALLALGACQTIPINVPKVEIKEPVKIKDAASLAAIKFDRVGIKIKRGTPIGSYEPDLLGLSGCLFIDGNIFWNQGRVLARDVEFADLIL